MARSSLPPYRAHGVRGHQSPRKEVTVPVEYGPKSPKIMGKKWGKKHNFCGVFLGDSMKYRSHKKLLLFPEWLEPSGSSLHSPSLVIPLSTERPQWARSVDGHQILQAFICLAEYHNSPNLRPRIEVLIRLPSSILTSLWKMVRLWMNDDLLVKNDAVL